jgi:hypothetical protein
MWPNRDPLGEDGGINLYQFAFNEPVSEYDPFGELPGSSQTCQKLARQIENLKKSIAKRQRELRDDPLGLPGQTPGDKNTPVSRVGGMSG